MSTETIYISVKCRGCFEIFHIPSTEEQYTKLNSSKGPLIQHIYPELSISDRELLISNICETCWNRLMPDEEK